MNSIIKTGSHIRSFSDGAMDVKPVDLISLAPRLAGAFDVESDPALCDDPALRAQLEARAAVRAAHEEAESIRKQAHDEGYRRGMEQAILTASELVGRLESDLEAVAQDRAEVLGAVEPHVLKLCLEIVEKIVRHEAKTDPRIVIRAIKSCLRRIKDSDLVCVRVSPSEVEEVKALLDDLAGLAQGVRQISVVEDRRISPGGCVVESAAGDFDARIESQLSRIDDKLRETLHNDRDKPHPEPGEVLSGDQPS